MFNKGWDLLRKGLRFHRVALNLVRFSDLAENQLVLTIKKVSKA